MNKETQEENPTITLPIYFEELEDKYKAGITGKYLIITNKQDKRKGQIILEPTQPKIPEDKQKWHKKTNYKYH